MTTALITYRVKPEELERHLGLLRAVYAELEAGDAQGLRYATFQLDDAGRFVEVVMGEDLPQPLPQLEAFRRYRADLEARCEERDFAELAEVGAFRF